MTLTTDPATEAVGRTETRHAAITPELANMLGAALDPDWTPAALPAGAVLPPLWHWAALHPDTALNGLGADGHPAHGTGLLPNLSLNRRMWAGGSLRFHRPLHLGERFTQTSRIASVERKTGATGPMGLVSVEHRIEGAAGLAVEEVQTLVYLEIPDRYRPPAAVPLPEAPLFTERHAMGPVRLFRYSAATYNAHRIHYDRAYAREVEHYPDLLVHGPLQATLLAAAATRRKGRAPDRFRYRGIHPMFDTHDLLVMGVDETETRLTLCTAAPGGPQGMQATAEWDA